MEQAYLPGTVRERIQDLLKERQITQAELASAIGLSESAFSRFLSGKTDKLGDEFILKIADHLGVSTDFILGQTDFPERRNYDIGELGLSYKAAMALYTRAVDTDVVNRMLESPQFPEITRMIARYFDDTFAEGFAGRNALLESVKRLAAGNEAVSQIIDAQKIQPDAMDLAMIQSALMDMLKTIKNGIVTRTPTTELVTKEIAEGMMKEMKKGADRVPIAPAVSEDQLAAAYAEQTGGTLESGRQFSKLIDNFIRGYVELAQKQGLLPDDRTDK